MREKEQMAEKGITEGLHTIMSEVIQITVHVQIWLEYQ